jgi:hypothetical protein
MADNFFDSLSDCQLFEKGSAPWSWYLVFREPKYTVQGKMLLTVLYLKTDTNRILNIAVILTQRLYMGGRGEVVLSTL